MSESAEERVARGGELTADARAAAKLGVFGGSFDPPHLGHLHVARRAAEAFGLDHVLFVPAARPPHKPERVLARGAARVEMLTHLLAEEPGTSVWAGELDRTGPSYTVDTLRELAAARSAGELFLLLGADNLAGLPGWHEANEVLRLARPIVVARSGSPLELDSLEGLAPSARAALAEGLLSVDPVDVSSTELRERLRGGEVPAELFPAALAEYLRASDIYRGS